MTTVWPAITLEYVRVQVTADVTLDAQPVAIALMPDGAGNPGPGDWHEATWEGDAGMTRVARLLVGPGGDVTLTAGWYVVWYRVTDNPEIPARPVDWLSVT